MGRIFIYKVRRLYMKKVLYIIGLLSFVACFLLGGCLAAAAGAGAGAGYYIAKHSHT